MIKINSTSFKTCFNYYLTSNTTEGGDWDFYITDCNNVWTSSLTNSKIEVLAKSIGFQLIHYKNLLKSAFCEDSKEEVFEFFVNKKDSSKDNLQLSMFQVLNEGKFLLTDLKFNILMSNGTNIFIEALYTSLKKNSKNAQLLIATNSTLDSECISLISQSQVQMATTKNWLEVNMMTKFCTILNEKRKEVKKLKNYNNTNSINSIYNIKTENRTPNCLQHNSDVVLTNLSDDYNSCEFLKLTKKKKLLNESPLTHAVAEIDQKITNNSNSNVIENLSDSSDTTIGPYE